MQRWWKTVIGIGLLWKPATGALSAIHGLPGFLEDSETWVSWGKNVMSSDLLITAGLFTLGVGTLTYDWWKPHLTTKLGEWDAYTKLRELPRRGIRFRQQNQEQDPLPSRRIRELDNEEKNVLHGIVLEVESNHGHNDFWGVYEDIIEGKRLSNGLCTECCKPRNQFILFNDRGEGHKNE